MSYTKTNRIVNDVLTHVKRQFGDESGVQITDADIIRWINAGQDEIFRRSEPVKATTYADLVAGQANYKLPDGVLRVQTLYVNGVPAEQKSTQEIEEYVLSQDPLGLGRGQSVAWSEWGGTITLYPTPELNAVAGLTLKYIKAPVLVENTTTPLSIPDAFYNRLIEYVLQQAYELDENFQASELKQTQFTMNLDAQSGRDQVTPNVYPSITILEEDM